MGAGCRLTATVYQALHSSLQRWLLAAARAPQQGNGPLFLPPLPLCLCVCLPATSASLSVCLYVGCLSALLCVCCTLCLFVLLSLQPLCFFWCSAIVFVHLGARVLSPSSLYSLGCVYLPLCVLGCVCVCVCVCLSSSVCAWVGERLCVVYTEIHLCVSECLG